LKGGVFTVSSDAQEALNVFLSIRKAEGLSPATMEGHRYILGLFLREHPDFLRNPRSAVLSFISEPENAWTRFTRGKVLRVFGKFLVEEGILNDSPMRGIKTPMPGKRVDIPTVEDVKAFLSLLNLHKFADLRLRCMILLALDTGLRRGELCGVQIADLNTAQGLLSVRPETSKVRRGRVVPVSPPVLQELRRFIARHRPEWKTPWVFPSETGGKLTPQNFGCQIRRVSDRGDARMKVHTIRHLCATLFLRQTGNIALTAALLGHASIAVTSRFYEHLDVKDLQEAHAQAAVISGVLAPKRKRKA